MSSDSILQIAEQYFREEVAPNAWEIDSSVPALQKALDGLCQRNLMALKRPLQYGGPALPENDFREFQEWAARVSGSLAFLQTQHQSAVGLIARSTNEALKQEYLPQMADGRKLVGIGISQLRRPGPPMVTAVPEGDGYRISGEVPWITGYGIYPEFILAAALPDGQSLFGIVPFTDQPLSDVQFSEPMKLAAMESAQTVTGTFTHFKLDADKVVNLLPKDWIFRNDQINITLQGFFAIGCAMGGVDVVRSAAEKRNKPFLYEAADKLEAEIMKCRTAMRIAQELSGEDTTQEKLNLRGWAIDLANRCAHAAVTASGGAANSIRHPAQRLLRESLVFTVSAQTEPIMEATLKRLIRDSE